MSSSQNELNPELETQTGISRRTIVRTGANAAWAVPLITVATAAPSMAASVAPNLAFTSTGIDRFNETIIVTARLTNIGNGKLTVAPKIIISLDPNAGEYAKRPTKGSQTGFGWHSAVSGGPNEGPWTWTFIYGAKLAPGQSTQTLKFGLGVGKNGLLSLTGTIPKQVRNPGGGVFTLLGSAGGLTAESKTVTI